MFSLYLFILTFKIASTMGIVIYSYRIAHMNMTPTLTWTLMCVAFSIRLVTQTIGIFYTGDIFGFLSQYPSYLVISTQMLEAIFTGCVITAVIRTFYGLKALGIK